MIETTLQYLKEFSIIIEVILQCLQAFSIIIASGVAIYGISSWREEFTGKRNIELAEDTLELFYRAGEAIGHIRAIGGFGAEGLTRKISEQEDPNDKETLDTAYITIERYLQHQEIFNKIHALRYRCRARFGTDSIKPFVDLNNLINEIISASRRLSRYWIQQKKIMNPERSEGLAEQVEEAEAIIWNQSEDDDKIQKRVQNIIEDIEGVCKPIIDKSLYTKVAYFKKKYFPFTFKKNKPGLPRSTALRSQ